MRSSWTIALLLGLAAAAPLGAQSASERLALAQGTLDSTSSVSSTTQLVQQGLQLLRSGKDRGDRDALFEALRDLNEARVQEPDWPWPRFGLALAKLALDEDGAISRPVLGGQLTGESYREGFWRSLEETFARDSMFEPGLRFAVQQAAEQRDRIQPEVIARAAVRAARRWPDDTLAQLAAGYVYRTALRYRDAAGAFRRFGALGGDTAIALLEEARSLAGDSELVQAAELYRAGAHHLSDSARARYRNDLSWVATRRELGEFDTLPRDSVSAWLTRFWQRRDALSLRAAGDRLQEHLRRWAYVYRNFRVDNPERWSEYLRIRSSMGTCSRVVPDSLNDVMLRDDASRLDDNRGDEAVLDHRAVIYMRHGAPAWGRPAEQLLADTGVVLSLSSGNSDQVTAIPSITQKPEAARSEVWVYWIQGRARAFYFGTVLRESQLGPLGLSPTLPVGLTPYLAKLNPVYDHAAHMFLAYHNGLPHATPLLCSPSVQAMTIQSEKDVQTAVRTDSYTLLFPHQFGALMQVYAVGSAYRGNARLLLTAAIPGTRLDSLVPRVDGWLQWPLHIRVTAVDTSAGSLARSDTVRTFARRVPFGPNEYFGFTAELPVRAGHYVTHAAVFDSTLTGGSAAEWGNVVVQPSAFSISDVVLGVERGGVLWENNGDPFEVNVTGAYHQGEPAPIYYEIYGRTPGRSYHTTISVRERGKRDQGRVAVEFSRKADRPDTHVQLTLDLSRLKPGLHEVMVVITDEESGAEVRTERVVEIRSATRKS